MCVCVRVCETNYFFSAYVIKFNRINTHTDAPAHIYI